MSDPIALMPQHTLSVVVPMYNEQENAPLQIDAVQDALKHYPMPWEMILVDDGSSDNTVAALLKRGLADAWRQLADLKPKELLDRRYARLQSYGRFTDTKAERSR